MAEIKVGDKVRLTQDVSYSNHKKGDIGVVTSYCDIVSGLIRVRMEYNNTYGDTAPFEPYEIELVEELAPLKLEHLKVGQLVIRKSDGWQRFITEVVEDKISYLCGSKGENLTIEVISLVTEFIGYYRLPDISEVAQFKKDNPETFAEYTVATPSFKVGDYLTEGIGDIVWKVTGVGEGGSLLTEALMIQDADDVVDTYRLGTVTLGTMKKATPEQVEAFENHPYWGKLEPVADAISPSVYQFPDGVEVRDISAHLTSFGGQAVQYIARATRLDGIVKGLPVQDLKKAIQLLEWEVERLEAGK